MQKFMLVLLVVGSLFHSVASVYATPVLTITPITWNVIGLDSNNVNASPNQFLIGSRVCNTGTTAATNVVVNFVWDSTNSFINLVDGSTRTKSLLNPSQCFDFYFMVEITRTTAAYDTVRRYRITAIADGLTSISTPSPREVFVERLVSQNRNSTTGISGPRYVALGQTYTYVVTSTTATNGYEQLEAFMNFPPSMFEIQSIQSTYSVGPNRTTLYADACNWNNNPTSPTYRSCTATGKAGGVVVTTYNVLIVGTGFATMNNLIYDFSGSSYHYNSDLLRLASTYTVTAVFPTSADLTSFTADAEFEGINVRWSTSSEVDSVGFNVYRSESSMPQATKQQVNSTLIPAYGTAASYRWFDATALPNVEYTYWLAEVDFNAQTTFYGPVTAQWNQAAHMFYLPFIRR